VSPPPRPNLRLRAARLAAGLSQADLARRANVSRQALSGLEAGRWSPSLDVALLLAAALGTSVEALFAERPPPRRLATRLAPVHTPRPPRARERVALARVGATRFAYPLQGDHGLTAGFVPAAGRLEPPPDGGGPEGDGPGGPGAGDVGAVAFRSERHSVVVAGCDPALALLAGPLGTSDPPAELVWWSCPNAMARALVEAGAAHAAAVHRPVGAAARRAEHVEVVGFASWREGLLVSPELEKEVRDLDDLARRGLPLANREVGSEARRLLDERREELGVPAERLAGYASAVSGHLLVASAVASGLAAAGVGSEPAGLAYGLEVVPWQEEVCELEIPRALLGTPEVAALLGALASEELLGQLEAVPGYDATPCGRVAGA
jgi:putative molybdopterin biosynthesis protein